MEFKILGENNLYDPIKTIFNNRGISDLHSFINCDEKSEIHYSKLKNIDKGVDCLLHHLEKGNHIFIQADSDIDGYSSAAILISYINEMFPDGKVTWRLQDGKEHGVSVKHIPENTSLVIIPDAGSNQINEHRILADKGIDVLVIDHHETEEESSYAIVVNNQLSPEYPNKSLSGAGIVYKFCKALDDRLNVSTADKYLDLVAFGNIGDIMDLRELETRFYVKKGLSQITNPLLAALVEKQEYSLQGIVNIIGASFYIVPLINAGIRVGTKKEKEEMMHSFLGSEEEVYYKRNNCYETLHTSVARKLYNLKNKQNKTKQTGTAIIHSQITEDIKDKVLIIDVTDTLEKNLTGLVANQLVEYYRRPVILLRRRKEGILAGSARGYEKSGIADLKEYLIKSELFNFCEGHSNAFGVEINDNKFELLKKYIEESFPESSNSLNETEVDLLLEEKNIDTEIITQIANYRDEWGSNIKEPLLGFKDVPVKISEVYLNGSKRKTLKFSYSGLDFIKPYFKESDFERDFAEGETAYLDIVGKCKINEWKGKKTPQIEIKDYEVKNLFYF